MLVDGGHFCASVVLEHGRCIAAAPILKWAVGKTDVYLRRYFEQKGWRAVRPRVKLS